MASALIGDLVAELPWAMRNAVEGYVDAVTNALPEIQRDAGISLADDKLDTFLFIVAIRRIWAAINSQYWIINDSVAVAQSRDLAGFKVGRDVFSKNSQAMLESIGLRIAFERMITQLDINDVVTTGTLSDALFKISKGE